LSRGEKDAIFLYLGKSLKKKKTPALKGATAVEVVLNYAGEAGGVDHSFLGEERGGSRMRGVGGSTWGE